MTDSSRVETFSGISSLALENELGNVRIISSMTDGTARVTLHARGDVDLAPVALRVEGDTLVVDVPPLLDKDSSGGTRFAIKIGPISFSTQSTRVDVEVELPQGADIKAKTKSGDITVTGEAGDVTARTGSGDVSLEHAQQVHIATGSGDVDVRSCRSGNVTTGSGDIAIREATGEELNCRAGSGDITVRHTASKKTSAATGSGDISFQLSAGTFEAKSGTGDIDLTVPRGLPVWLDLVSGTGQVVKDIESVGAPQEDQPFLSVKAKSGVGSIRLHH